MYANMYLIFNSNFNIKNVMPFMEIGILFAYYMQIKPFKVLKQEFV